MLLLKIGILCGFSVLPSLRAFSPTTIHNFNSHNIPTRQNGEKSNSWNTLLSSKPQGQGDESEEDLASRMDVVRQLQKAFYQNEDIILPPEKGSKIMKDLPLWRVQWTELPGFQNVLNVHVAHYTNMFQKILFSDAKPKYFGHVYLPGGSDNLDNPEYKLEEGSKASLVGVLMQIADYQQQDDGRLTLIVQALEKFRIVEAQRHHSPYAIATVEILPDEEFIESFDDSGESISDHIKAVETAFQLHPYEVRSVTMEDCAIEGEMQRISVSPLSNFDGNFKIPENFIEGNLDPEDDLFETEQKVWIKLDEMINLLQQLVDPNNEEALPIPTQILGLLPLNPYKPWPENFALEKYATKLEIEKILVGTFSKSPFVRVDTIDGYSPYRRAQRLSFLIPVLTETVIALGNEEGNTRQQLLEMENTEERLEAALQKLDLICSVINELLQNK